MINKYTDPIITNYRFDSSGSKITVPITESLKITNGIIFLKEIPDKRNGTTISSFSEVQKPEDLDSENKFYVDYNTGVVYFDTKKNGTQVSITYHGIGIVYYPASRIYLEVDENHDIVKTLSDIEGQISSLSGLRNEQKRLKQEIEDRNSELNKSIEEARTIDLSGSVDKAKQTKTELEDTTKQADAIKRNLNAQVDSASNTITNLKNQEDSSKREIQKSVSSANTAKSELNASVQNLDNKIKSINSASEKADGEITEINSKIAEASTAEQKLTTTKNEITTSLSDYEKKSAEIKSSTNDIESKNSELKSTISRADESNTTLNSTIEKSKDSNTALSGTVEESKTKNTELSSSITTATDLKGQLEIKNKEASGNIDSLNSKISEGTQLKSDLDTSTTNANQANAELKDTTNKANLSKTQLDESKASADELNKNLLNNKNELTTLDNSLKAENEKATKNISDLDTKSASGKQIIDDLNSATSKSETAKTNLDDSNTKATQTNAELKATTQTANDTKTSLEQIKNESSTLSNELSEGNTTASSNIESLKSENQSAKTNITGLQTENQNALSKQETLSSETTKANEAIAKIAELITSSTDLKNKLEQIVASGDLDKYITDPKLREILTAYATKDDLSKVDVTSQLIDYAKKAEVPSKLSQLENDIKLQGLDDVQRIINKYIKNAFEIVPRIRMRSKDYLGVCYTKSLDRETNTEECIVFTFSDPAKQEKYEGNAIRLAIELKTRKAFVYAEDRAIIYPDSTVSLRNTSKWKEIPNPLDSIPTSLSQLTDDETHRLVTDTEKNKWNNPPNPDLTDYAKKADLDTKANKSELPSALSQLANDTKFKTEAEIQEMIAKSSKLKKEVTTSLPTTGEDDVIYLVKDTKGKDNNNYLEYLWIDGKWELIGSTQVDLSGYATKSEVESKAEKADVPTKVSQLENDEEYIKQTALRPLARGGWRSINGTVNFNTAFFRQGLEIIDAQQSSNNKQDFFESLPDGLGKYFVYTSFKLSLDGVYQAGYDVQQLIFCLKNRRLYYRRGTITRGVRNGVKCEWGELQEIESPTQDLSPFTQQELEEAFK